MIYFLAIAVLLAASPARAWEPTPEVLTEIAAGRTWFDFKPQAQGAGLIRAGIENSVPPDVVFAVLADCEHATRIAPHLASCRVTERDPSGRWDIREQITRAGLLPSVRTVVRSDFQRPASLKYRRVGGDLAVLEGEWRMISIDGGRRTRVLYENRASSPNVVPGAIARLILRREIGLALAALTRECQSRL